MAKPCNCIIHQTEPDQYYAIRDDGILALYKNGAIEPLKEYPKEESLLIYSGYEDIWITGDDGTKRRTQKTNDRLPYDGKYTMELLGPWLSVFQKYGTNGCVYHVETGERRQFSRENYHADVSSYSNGLLVYKGQICLLHQTEWNRLDITNLETGVRMTDREVYYRLLDETDDKGQRKHEEKNYVDYFHGRICFSPDYQYFLDLGWVWQPDGVPFLYRTEDFLEKFENSRINLTINDMAVYCDDWDQGAAWLDNDTFLIQFMPDVDFLEEDSVFADGAKSVLLQFDVGDIRMPRKVNGCRTLHVEKVLPPPFVTSKLSSVYLPKQGETVCCEQMLDTDLYWDGKENLLIGILGNELLVFDRNSGASYSIRYGGETCFYSVDHHMAYQMPPWPGNFKSAPIRSLLKAARACYFTPCECSV